MNILDQIELYLPKYLSAETESELFEQIGKFPENIDSRFYTNSLKDTEILYQGDGLRDLLFVNLPDPKIGELSAMVISNTCDTYPGNVRFFHPNVVYSPIFSLAKYREKLLSNGIEPNRVQSHLVSIRKQRITSIFYLPEGPSLVNESIIFFDRINSCDSEFVFKKKISDCRIFTLSQYGHYLFVLKLSIHFSRIMESVDRNQN